jgi:hypothetical protein
VRESREALSDSRVGLAGARTHFVAHALGKPDDEGVAAEDGEVDVAEKRVVGRDDDGKEIRRGFGPLGEFFAAGEVLDEFEQELRVAGLCVPAFR